jgi:hypothetical protein
MDSNPDPPALPRFKGYFAIRFRQAQKSPWNILSNLGASEGLFNHSDCDRRHDCSHYDGVANRKDREKKFAAWASRKPAI